MKLVASVLLAVAISSCASSSSSSNSEGEISSTTSSVTSTTQGAIESTTVATTAAGLQTSTTTSIATVTSGNSGTVSSSAVPATTTSVVVNRPKLSVSQTTNLNPSGTSVTVRGTGFDVSKGVYVIVCSQAAPGPQATCIGGVNIDGSSSSSVWVSSNPPNYAVGLTTPFQPDGSFIVDLVIVAKSGALDCTAIRCGVVTRSDHLRYTDRTQDVFVPISFTN
jgi:pectate lyase